jgi:hypothetical protein
MARDYFPLEPLVASPAGGKLIALVGSPSDGDVPIYNSGTGRFEPGAPLSSVSLDDLGDVDLTGLADGDVLTYDSGSGLWVPAAPGGGSLALDDLSDVDAAAPNDGDVLTYDSGSGNWVPEAPSAGSSDPYWYDRRHWRHQVNAAASAYESLLLPSTLTGSGTTSAATDGNYFFINIAGSGTVSLLPSSFAWMSRDARGVWVCRFKTGADITSIRLWLGLFTASPSTASDPASQHIAAFRYDTTADGTAFWRTVTKDGTTINAAASSLAIAADTIYLFRIELDASEVRFYSGTTLLATHTANLPTSSQTMAPCITLTPHIVASRSFRYGRQEGSFLG